MDNYECEIRKLNYILKNYENYRRAMYNVFGKRAMRINFKKSSEYTDDIVKFENVFTNIGKAYNKDTGIFIAPKTGLYVFHIHGLSTPNNGFWFILYHNDLSLYKAHGRGSDNYTSSGNSIVLSVKSGDKLFVRVQFPSTVHGGGLNRYATFTGYLIAAGTEA